MNFFRAFDRHPHFIICFFVALLISTLTSKLVPFFVNAYYDKVEEEHKYDTGRDPSDDITRAYSIDDLLSNERFAIVVDDWDQFSLDGSARSNEHFSRGIYNVRLQSGERVAVKCDDDMATLSEDGVYLLCVGEVKWEDLTEDADMLAQLQREYSLDRTDFYVDASLDYEVSSKYSTAMRDKMIDFFETSILIDGTIILWIALHCISVKIGIAPPLFERNR